MQRSFRRSELRRMLLGAAFGGFGVDSLCRQIARLGSETTNRTLSSNPARKNAWLQLSYQLTVSVTIVLCVVVPEVAVTVIV